MRVCLYIFVCFAFLGSVFFANGQGEQKRLRKKQAKVDTMYLANPADSVLLLNKPRVSSLPTRFITLGLSANAYRGSLSESYSRFTPNYHLGLAFNRKRIFNGSLNVLFGNVIGENRGVLPVNESGRTPANYFNTSYWGVYYGLALNFFKNDRFRVYGELGAGFLSFTARDVNGNALSEQRNTRTNAEADYSSLSLILPIHFGMNYFFPSGYGLGFQLGWLNQNSNYLDNTDELALYNRRDNVLSYRFSVLIPWSFKPKAGGVSSTKGLK